MTRVALARRPPSNHYSETPSSRQPGVRRTGRPGRRWAEMAHRAAQQGSKGDTLALRAARSARRVARARPTQGAKLLVVVGGDGSVNEVANGIAGRSKRTLN